MSLPLSQVAAPSTAGCRLVSIDGRAIPLVGVHVSADAGGGLARVVVEQRFSNTHADPLTATYQLPLPADGAVVGFSFLIGERRIVGEIDRKHRARQRFEQAIAQGRTAAILDQDRSSLFTQEIGNIPPGAEVIAEITVEQPLTWKQGSWEWRFPTVVAPRFMGSTTPDAARVSVDVADGPLSATAAMTLQIRDGMTGPARSTTHALQGAAELVSLPEGTALDRDIVVRWRVATPAPTASLELSQSGSATHGLLTIVPPVADTARSVVPRDLILLLDTSGSMGGRPLDQAKALGRALIDGMTAQDRLEMISFASRPDRWKSGPVSMGAIGRAQARRWLESQRARGSTQMRDGIIEALKSLRPGAQRQIILVSDGLIGFEKLIISTVLDKLPASSRVHTIGVGSGVNRSLTGPVARAGGGVEVVIGLDESSEEAAQILLARTSRPEIVDFTLSGTALIDHAPRRLPDLFAGSPSRISLHLKPGTLILSGHTAAGPWQTALEVPDTTGGRSVLATRFAREKVEDLELRIAAGGDKAVVDAQIEALGLSAGISTRLTSWIAATEEATVDPSAPTRTERVPHALPYGMSAEGAGLRRSRAVDRFEGFDDDIYCAVIAFSENELGAVPPSAPMSASQGAPRRGPADRFKGSAGGGGALPPSEEEEESVMDAEDSPMAGDFFGSPADPEPVIGRSRASARGGRQDKAPSRAFDGLRKKLSRRRATPKAPAKSESESVSKEKAAPISRTLIAVVKLHANGQLILEIILTAALDWAPTGTSLGMPVGGTRAGRYDAGQRIRLVLSLAEGAAIPTEITVDSSGTPLKLVVKRS
ncbi:MAG: Ca-activated chloride channel family protein [Myxococcota bacterium]|jgi:Ca-activated chloride channel family protein